MLTNTERQQIVEEVNAGTYGIDEALDDIAAAQKGEEVRKALYAEALVLNREGHAGSTDMIARQQIANLQTSVNGQISTLRTEVGEDIDDLETALNSGLATQNGRIAAQDATIANVVANYNLEYGSETLWKATGETGLLASGTTATLSKDVSNFDYVDIYSFCGNNNILDTLPVDSKLQSTQGYATRWVNLSDPGSGSYKAYVRIIETRLHIIGTTLTIDHQVTYRNGEEVNISGAEITQGNRSTYVGELGIMKIVGRKVVANAEVEDIRLAEDGTEYGDAGQSVRAQIGGVKTIIGELSDLDTDNKDSVVDAINEALTKGGSGKGIQPEDADLLKEALYMGEYSTTERAAEAKDKIDALISSLKELNVVSIEVSYTGGAVVEGTNISDLTGVIVTATYSDDSTDVVENYTLSAGTIAVGDNVIVVTYRGKTASFTVTGTAKPVASISAVYSGGDVVEDTPAEDLREDITVNATYTDGTTATVTGWAISGTVTVGTNVFAITYGGKSTTITVTGTEKPKPNLLLTSAVRTIDNAYYGMYNDQIRYFTSSDWGTMYVVPVQAGKTYRYSVFMTEQYGNPYVNNYQLNSLRSLSPDGTAAASAGANKKTFLMGTFDGDYDAITTTYSTHYTMYEVASTGASVTNTAVDGGYRKSLDITYSHDGYALFAYKASQCSAPILNEVS